MIKELVSIVVPIYKVEEYLAECVESLISQTYKNIEILLIDDGSPDGCGKICDEYAKKDDRIKVFHKKNGGLSSARNFGIKESSGEYICFIDSDDYIDARYIEVLLKNIKEKDLDFAACDVYYLYENNQVKKTDLLKNNMILLGDTVIETLFKKQYILLTISTNKLYKKSLFLEKKFKEGIIHEDEEIAYRLLCDCKKIELLNHPLYYYRQRNNSIVRDGKIDNHTIVFEIFKERYYFLKERYKNKKIVGGAAYSWLNSFLIYANKYYKNGEKDKYLKCIKEQKNIKREITKQMTAMFKMKYYIKLFLCKIHKL